MPQVIGQRTFALGGTDTYTALYCDELVRQMSISNNWSVLRIGLLASINSTYAFPAARFRIGICNYNSTLTQAGFAWSSTNWCGYNFPSVTATVANLQAGPPPYWDFANAESGVRTGTGFTGFGTNTGPVYVATSGTRSVLIIEFTKGSPNYTIKGWGVNSSGLVAADYQFSDLSQGIQDTVNTPPKINGVSLVGYPSSGNNGAVGENAGIFDAFAIGWEDPVFPLELYAVAVYRVS